MHLGKRPRKRETYSETLRIWLPFGAVLDERLEYLLTAFGRDGRPVVDERDLHKSILQRDLDIHKSLGVLHSVVDQIVKHLQKTGLIDIDDDPVLHMLEGHPQILAPCGLLEIVVKEAYLLDDVHLLVLQHPSVLLDADEVKELLNQLVQIVRAVADDLQILQGLTLKASGRHNVVKRGPDKGERGLDLVDDA